jgi:hypothetical protein
MVILGGYVPAQPVNVFVLTVFGRRVYYALLKSPSKYRHAAVIVSSLAREARYPP